MEMEGLIEKRLGNDERRRNKNHNLFITIWAMVLFVVSSCFLYRSFFLTDSLKAAQTAASILWTVIFFLIFYPFRTATLIGMLWFEYKKMELNIPKPEEQTANHYENNTTISVIKEQAELVHKLLGKLKLVHRDIITLYFLEGFSIQEIAQIIDISEGTVKSRLYYAKHKLHEMLKGAKDV